MAGLARSSEEAVVLVIDELTRTDPARVMGEVLTYMERSLRGVEFRLPSGRPTTLPENLVFLATANLEDRSVDELDSAMERRWSKIYLRPDVGRVATFLRANNISDRDISAICTFFSGIQDFIPFGHAYFRAIANASAMERLWERQIAYQVRRRYRYETGRIAAAEELWQACKAVIFAPEPVPDEASPPQ